MSQFSAVDDSENPAALIESLDHSARGLAAMKQYMAAAAARAVAAGSVLDIGCGAGHDLTILAAAGLRSVGIDASAAMAKESRKRTTAPILQATGAALPFRDRSFDGCRIERVLQHVPDPQRIVDEAGRVTRPRGFLAVFEPDWTSLELSGAQPEVANHVRGIAMRPISHDVGARLAELVEAAGYVVRDLVTEQSFGYAVRDLPVPPLPGVDPQRPLLAGWRKVLVVAERLP